MKKILITFVFCHSISFNEALGFDLLSIAPTDKVCKNSNDCVVAFQGCCGGPVVNKKRLSK
jgi:hypothetical protein